MSRRLIVIHGATGVGKTDIAIKIAMNLGCPIISADSRQFYKEMSIGTAVPNENELTLAKHYFIHSHSVQEPISAGQFEGEALDLLDSLFLKYDNVIMVGGSGLYINAVLYGMDALPSDQDTRNELAQKSLGELCQLLKINDPEYYNIVDRDNKNRVTRAVEVCLITGQKYSDLRTGNRKKRNFESIQFALDRPRKELYDRINQRVEVMIANGLEKEAKLVEKFKNSSALQTVGYREFFDYFDGKISCEQTVDLIKRNSRRYAKRQYTWLRSIDGLKWVSAEEVDKILKMLNEIG